MHSFSAKILKIGINPYVLIPADILREIFKQANRNKGPIAVRGDVNGFSFTQTLVKYSGKWRLYLNGVMRKAANADVGDVVEMKIEFNPEKKELALPPKLKSALDKNRKANKSFSELTPSRQKEIVLYIGHLKTEEAVDRNVRKVIQMLTGI